jgi:Uma2 family endonuclease
MSDMATAELKLRKLSVAEYHRMVDTGILEEDERIELLDGIIVEMSPLSQRHVALHSRIVAYLLDALGGRAVIAGHFSLRLGEFDEPQPDIGIFAPEPDSYFGRPPTIDEPYALIEISDSSLQKDTGPKRELYARFGIEEYLVVDVSSSELLRYSGLFAGQYGTLQRLRYGDTFDLSAPPGVTLEVDRFLPAISRS